VGLFQLDLSRSAELLAEATPTEAGKWGKSSVRRGSKTGQYNEPGLKSRCGFEKGRQLACSALEMALTFFP
jgi:hypothetical protein